MPISYRKSFDKTTCRRSKTFIRHARSALRQIQCVFASLAQEGEWIVDVGANVGDTAVAFIQHTKANVLCIEGCDEFIGLLTQNVTSLPQDFSSRIRIVKAMVGSGKTSGLLLTEGGTARINQGAATIATTPIDEILQINQIPGHQVSVFKSDTDGFDPDLVLSGKALFFRHSPILYFENNFTNDQEPTKYEQLYDALDS